MEPSQHEHFLKKFPLPQAWTVKKEEGKIVLFCSEEGLVFSLDFSLKKALSNRQPLAKAIGFKGEPLFVLDITAGWAQEAFLISKMGCHVTAVESHPFVFHFVQEALAQLKPPGLNFVLDNSLNYLKTIKETNSPDVIYMDPMFGDKKKSLSNKSLRILKRLVGETKDKEELFDWALKKAKKRVVVKRHRLEPSLKGKSLCVFEGRSVCYDVFMPRKR